MIEHSFNDSNKNSNNAYKNNRIASLRRAIEEEEERGKEITTTRRRTKRGKRYPSTSSLSYYHYSDGCDYIATSTSTARNMTYIYSSLFAGIGSGALSSVVCAPLDLLRTRMQVWGDLKQASSSSRSGGGGGGNAVSFFKQIAEKEGWRGCFRGLNATLATVPLFWGIYFPLYDDLKQTISSSSSSELHPSLVHCISAVSAGAVADVICNPLFVIRTRLQTEGLHNAISASNNTSQRVGVTTMYESALVLYREGGISIFWRGLSASMLGLTHVGVQFPVYEFLKDQARKRRGSVEETPLDLLVSSALSKMTASILAYPHEVVRSRMMDTRGNAESATFSNTIKRIWQQEGFYGFYSGLPVSLVRVVPNCCVTFLTYELLLRYAKQKL